MLLDDRYESPQKNVRFWKPLSQVRSTENALGFCTFKACQLEVEPARVDSFIVLCAVTFEKGKVLSAIFWVHSCVCPSVCLAVGMHVTPSLLSEHSLLNCLGKGAFGVLFRCNSRRSSLGLSCNWIDGIFWSLKSVLNISSDHRFGGTSFV